MGDISSAIQIDLAFHLGLVAIAVTLVIWALGSVPPIGREIRVMRSCLDTGFAPRETVFLIALKYSELLLKAIGFVLTLRVLMLSFSFFEIIERLVGPYSSAIDLGLFERIWEASESITHEMISLTGLVVSIFFFSYTLGAVPSWLGDLWGTMEIPRASHSHEISREWTSFPEAMWEERLRSVIGRQDDDSRRMEMQRYLRTGVWRTEWSTWTKCVIAYQSFAERELRSGQQEYPTRSGQETE